MKKEFGQLVKHSGIYGIGSILSKCVGFLMIPVYTHYLIPADYGVLEMLDLTVFFTGIFGMMGINGAFFRFFSAADSKEEKNEVTVTALATVVGISIGVLGLMEALAAPFSVLALGNAHYVLLIRIVAFTFFFTSLTEIPFAYIRAERRTALYVILGLAKSVFNATLLILALAVLRKGVLGVVCANVISNGIAAAVLVSVLLLRVQGKLSRKKFGEMFRYGAPLVVRSIAMFVLIYSDRLFLRHFVNLAAVGIYGLGYKLAGMVSLVVSGPFAMTWAWQQFELAKKDNAKEMYARIQLYQMIVLAFFGLAIALLAKDALRVLTPASYWEAARVVPLIVLSYVLLSTRSIVRTGILVRRKTYHIAWISVVTAAVTLLLNYVLISRDSYMGAAIATVLASGLGLILSYAVAQRTYFIHYDYLRNLFVFGSATAIYLGSTLFNLPLLSSISVSVVLIGVFTALSIAVLRREERAMLWQLVARALEMVGSLRLQHQG